MAVFSQLWLHYIRSHYQCLHIDGQPSWRSLILDVGYSRSLRFRSAHRTHFRLLILRLLISLLRVISSNSDTLYRKNKKSWSQWIRSRNTLSTYEGKKGIKADRNTSLYSSLPLYWDVVHLRRVDLFLRCFDGYHWSPRSH